jgi:hypothetical protein
MRYEKLDIQNGATLLANYRHLTMALYGRNMLRERKGAMRSCIVDGSILYEMNKLEIVPNGSQHKALLNKTTLSCLLVFLYTLCERYIL